LRRPASRSLAEWLEFQQAVHPRSIDLELSRVSAVARTLGVHRPACPVITVGGTNGKGSVAAHLDAMLRCSGVTTGLFTSPHLVRYNERIKVGGDELSDAELVAAFERIEDARGDITLTYFEYSTLAALLLFGGHAVEVAILEVGLGGRLDATNIVDPTVAVVASIGLDHRDWLGNTLEEIGREKAGIFRPGSPVVLGSPQMPESIFEAIDAIGARPVIAERDFTWNIGNGSWNYRGPTWDLRNLPASALPGTIQYRNAATAIAALEALNPAATGIAGGLRAVQLPGRFQVIPGPVEWILDVAHNEPAAQVFAAHLRARPCTGRTHGVVGILADKDIAAIAKVLDPLLDCWILCSLNEPRGLSALALATRLELPNTAFELADSVAAGCELARSRAKPGDRIVVCGSFLVVGAVLQWL
jgi:dihydrofolate synthase / folylpolyglutamate synthase